MLYLHKVVRLLRAPKIKEFECPAGRVEAGVSEVERPPRRLYLPSHSLNEGLQGVGVEGRRENNGQREPGPLDELEPGAVFEVNVEQEQKILPGSN